MARSFTAASSQYLETGSAPVTAVPVTLACWVYPSDTAGSGYVPMTLTTGTTSRFQLLMNGGVAGDPVLAQAINTSGTIGQATTTVGFAATTWQHVCGVFAASNSRAIYLDGANKQTNTTSVTVATPDRVTLGTRYSSGARGLYFNGSIAEAAIWNVALSDSDVAILAMGVSPLLVRPDALVWYAPIVGQYSPEIDLRQGISATVTGAVAAEHPRVFYPKRRGNQRWTVAAAAAYPHYYYQQRRTA